MRDSELLAAPPSLENHHRLIRRQSSIVESHTNQLMMIHEKFKNLENDDPVKQLRELELEFIEKLHKEVTRVRTALYIAAIVLGGGYGSGKAIEALKEPQPVNVQVVAPKVQP